MGNVWLVVLLSITAGLADIIGGLIPVSRKRLSEETVVGFIALGAGFLLAATFLERLPEALGAASGPIMVLGGYLVLLVTERLLVGRVGGGAHYHSSSTDSDEVTVTGGAALAESGAREEAKPLVSSVAGAGAFIGILVHAFFDGVAVAAGFATGTGVGVLVFVAVLLHKLPEGLGMSAIVLAAARSRAWAFWSVVALGAATFAGALLTIVAAEVSPALMQVALALATGSFVYVAASDLVPLITSHKASNSLLSLSAGIVIYLVSFWALGLMGLE